MSDLPIHSEIEELRDPVRSSYADDFAEARLKHDRGVFGAPEPEAEEAGLEVDPDHIIATVGENMKLRDQVAAQENVLADSREQLLDLAAYGGQASTPEEFGQLGDALMAAGGGLRLEALVGEFADQYPDEADRWLQSREAILTSAYAAESQRVGHELQQEVERQYVDALATFQSKHPDTRPGGLAHEVVAGVLASDPTSFSSPQAFTSALENAYRQSQDALHAFGKAAEVSAMKQAMRAEINRHGFIRQVTPEHQAASNDRAARSAQTLDGLGDDILRRTKSYRQSVAKDRAAEIHRSMGEEISRYNRGAFGEGK